MPRTDSIALPPSDRPRSRARSSPSRLDGIVALLALPSKATRRRAVAVVVLGLTAATVIVYATGGVKYALVHLAYLPIIFAALEFEIPGAVATAVVAGLLLGPFMPIDTATGEAQEPLNWLLRLLFFCVIGAFVGFGAGVLRRQMRQLSWLNEHDAGTGLLSHAGLMTALQARLVDPSLPPAPLIVVVQLSNYLDIQNAFGSEFGDQLLQRICERGRELLPDRPASWGLTWNHCNSPPNPWERLSSWPLPGTWTS